MNDKLLTEEEIMEGFCDGCDYLKEGCVELHHQDTCSCYQSVLKDKRELLAKAEPLIRKETAEEIRKELNKLAFPDSQEWEDDEGRKLYKVIMLRKKDWLSFWQNIESKYGGKEG